MNIKEPIKALILDMDGVLWRASTPIGNLRKIFTLLNEMNLSVTLATNNSTLSPDQYLRKISDFGVDLEPAQILTSSQVAAKYLAEKFPQGGPVFTIGEEGLKSALHQVGFYHQDHDVIAVVVGMDREINYQKLSNACLLIRSGALFIGTNGDRTYPTPLGLVPGAGSILAALETSTDQKPFIVGKPEISIYNSALKLMKSLPVETLVVGDRLETDIAGGQRLGCKTALVLSGVTTKDQGISWYPPPDYIFNDLEELVGAFG
jgi:4-nitrophenyl phosphatase